MNNSELRLEKSNIKKKIIGLLFGAVHYDIRYFDVGKIEFGRLPCQLNPIYYYLHYRA